MREIKFRVWCKQYEEFIQFNKMGFLEDGSLWYVQGVDENEKEIDPPYFENQNDWELMQYTGLKDKNGVEIYEHDIFRFGGRNYVVMYNLWSFGCFEDDKYFQLGEIFYRNGKVVGNIYENPELLEREAE